MFYYPTKDIKKDCEPIIFIHGTGMDHSVWTLPVRYFLRKKREVLAIDLPGHGNSEGSSLESIEDMADWLNRVVEVIGIKDLTINEVNHD